jgi:transcriptional regulator of acetoin/glycerol metabolism
MMNHALDPEAGRGSTRLPDRELSERRDTSERVCRIADPLLDSLFSLVCTSGCGVFLSDGDGVILDHRLRDGDASAFERWNLWSGAVWSEDAEGTNGIGTCLAEARPIVIHRDEHFAARNTGMSCMDAPIFGPTGTVIGALDVSSARFDHSTTVNRLVLDAVTQTARQISSELFRQAYEGCRVVVADREGAALLAVDSDDIAVGANRAARRQFGIRPGDLMQPVPAVDLLQDQLEHRGLDRGEHAAIKRALLRNEGNTSAAARALGIGRATLYRRMKRLGALD